MWFKFNYKQPSPQMAFNIIFIKLRFFYSSTHQISTHQKYESKPASFIQHTTSSYFGNIIKFMFPARHDQCFNPSSFCSFEPFISSLFCQNPVSASEPLNMDMLNAILVSLKWRFRFRLYSPHNKLYTNTYKIGIGGLTKNRAQLA